MDGTERAFSQCPSICFTFPSGSGSRPSIAHAVKSDAIHAHTHCRGRVPRREWRGGRGASVSQRPESRAANGDGESGAHLRGRSSAAPRERLRLRLRSATAGS